MNIHDSMKFAAFLGPGAIQTDKYSVEDPSDKPMRAGGPGSGRRSGSGTCPSCGSKNTNLIGHEGRVAKCKDCGKFAAADEFKADADDAEDHLSPSSE